MLGSIFAVAPLRPYLALLLPLAVLVLVVAVVVPLKEEGREKVLDRRDHEGAQEPDANVPRAVAAGD